MITSAVIASETPDDTEAIHRLHQAAFGGPLKARLVDALGESDRLVA